MLIGDCIMTNKQLNSYLESIKIIAENTKDNQEIIKAIEKLQEKLKE